MIEGGTPPRCVHVSRDMVAAGPLWLLVGVAALSVIASLFLQRQPALQAFSSNTTGPAESAWSNLNGEALKAELHLFSVKDHRALSYRQVWEALEAVDKGVDIYTGGRWPVGESSGSRCGGQREIREGQCFNREHAWPKSWWGGFKEGGPASTDLYALFLVDGHANAQRADLPFGAVDNRSAIFATAAGAKMGPCLGTDALPWDFAKRCCCPPHVVLIA